MIEVIEIPVLTVEKYQSKEFFAKLSFQMVPETGAVEYAEYAVTTNQLVYFYRLGKFLDSDDFTACDRLIPKAAFCWLLYERQDVAFEKMVKTYTEHYSTPLICLTPQPAEETLDHDREPIPQWPVLYYNSLSENPVREALRLSLAKMGEMTEAETANTHV